MFGGMFRVACEFTPCIVCPQLCSSEVSNFVSGCAGRTFLCLDFVQCGERGATRLEAHRFLAAWLLLS